MTPVPGGWEVERRVDGFREKVGLVELGNCISLHLAESDRQLETEGVRFPILCNICMQRSTPKDNFIELVTMEKKYCTMCNKKMGGNRTSFLQLNVSSASASIAPRSGLRSQITQAICRPEINIRHVVDELVEKRLFNSAKRRKWASGSKIMYDRIMESVILQPFCSGAYQLLYDKYFQ